MRLKARIGEPRDHLPYSATDVEHAASRLFRTKCISVLRVEILIPAGEEFCISFILAVTFLVAHRERSSRGRARRLLRFPRFYPLLLAALRDKRNEAT